MRIGIDLRRMNDTGIGRFARNLTKAILAQSPENDFVIIVGHPDHIATFEGDSRRVKYVVSPARRYSSSELISPLLIARRERLDLLHVPHQFHLPLFNKWATVVTIHDLTQVTHPPSPKARRLRLFYTKFLSLVGLWADRVCTDSVAAKKSISTLLRIPAPNITVVEGAVDPLFSVELNRDLLEELRAQRNLPLRIVLYVGMWKPHKNLIKLIEAFALLVRDYCIGENTGLVIVGPADPQNEESIRKTSERLGISKQVYFTGKLSDADLRLVYNLADVFAQPSLSEGFGLTLLEAMSCGTPVVASRIPPHEEIAGDAVVLVDPLNPGDMAKGINRVLCDSEFAHKLAQAGLVQVRNFSWERAARETLAVYSSVLSGRSRQLPSKYFPG